jgi:hypothetical protein
MADEKEASLVEKAISLKKSTAMTNRDLCRRLKKSLYWVRKALGK